MLGQAVAAQAALRAVEAAANVSAENIVAEHKSGETGTKVEDDKTSSGSSQASGTADSSYPVKVPDVQQPAGPAPCPSHSSVEKEKKGIFSFRRSRSKKDKTEASADRQVYQDDKDKGKAQDKNRSPKRPSKGLFAVGDSSRSLRGVREAKEKRLYREPKAMLPAKWETDWEALRLGKGPAIWED
jgi:hypothetical protein